MKRLKTYARHADGHYAQVNDSITPTSYTALLDDAPTGAGPTCLHLARGSLVLQPEYISACCICGSGYGEEPMLFYGLKEAPYKDFASDEDFNEFWRVLQQRLRLFCKAVARGWVPRCYHCAFLEEDRPGLHGGQLCLVNIGVHTQCQLRCIYCWQWRDTTLSKTPVYRWERLLEKLLCRGHVGPQPIFSGVVANHFSYKGPVAS